MLTRPSWNLLLLSLVIAVGGAAAVEAAEVFTPVAPCRAVDTRSPPQVSPVPLANKETRAFTLQGVCGVPVGASAVAVNVTVVVPGSQGFLSIFPGNAGFTGSSNLNFPSAVSEFANDNGSVVPLSVSLPDIKVYWDSLPTSPAGTFTTHVLIDVFGYYAPDLHTGASFFGRFGGDGSSGALTVAAGDTVTAPERAEYTSLTIEATGTLLGADIGDSGHTLLAVQGRCTIAGALDADGLGILGGMGDGESGHNAVGMIEGSRREQVPFCFTGAGGGGGSVNELSPFLGGHGGGGSRQGGAGQTSAQGFPGEPPPASWFVPLGAASTSGTGTTRTDNFAALLHCHGAGGGAGNVGSDGGTFGHGGRGGGVIYLECGELDFTGTLSARGEDGGDGTGAVASGGGGGGGGVILVRTKKIIANSGTVNVDGGAGGTPIGGADAYEGGAGAAGYWDVVIIP